MISVRPVTPDRRQELEKLFGPQGAYWGCWCMFWRLRNKDFNETEASERKSMLLKMVDDNEVPGLLAFIGDKPVGWMSIAPRHTYKKLEASRVIKKVDEKEVLSIVCFYINEDYRKKGVGTALVNASIDFAKQQGYDIIESYPVANEGQKVKSEGAYVGISSVFEKAGFEKVADTKSKSGGMPRIIMRYYLE